jgi:hypothetical protein
MPADYLFTWKPGHWPYSEMQRLVASFEAGGPAVEPWRCQSHRRIRVGDNAYMVKLGSAPKGIFGVGVVSGEPYRNSRASNGENPWLVPITFDLLVDPTKSVLMPEPNLITLDAPKHRWHPQGSGITLEASAARAIDRFVNRKTKPRFDGPPNTASAVAENTRVIIPKEHLLDVFEMLARSIQTANQFASEKWGIRINSKSIMLKVGFVEVLQFFNDTFHHLVRSNLIPDRARRHRQYSFYPFPYRNAPGCDAFDGDLSISKRAYDLLLPAHEAAIEIAAKSPVHTTTKSDHSPELVDLISRTLKIRLPQPSYIKTLAQTPLYPDKPSGDETFTEGEAISILVNRYERDPAAREKCIEHYGANCVACGMSFGTHYGHQMSGFIHIHHLKPLGSVRKKTTVDAIRDLRPVCPNCHAVIHSSDPPLTIDQVQSLVREQAKRQRI